MPVHLQDHRAVELAELVVVGIVADHGPPIRAVQREAPGVDGDRLSVVVVARGIHEGEVLDVHAVDLWRGQSAHDQIVVRLLHRRTEFGQRDVGIARRRPVRAHRLMDAPGAHAPFHDRPHPRNRVRGAAVALIRRRPGHVDHRAGHDRRIEELLQAGDVGECGAGTRGKERHRDHTREGGAPASWHVSDHEVSYRGGASLRKSRPIPSPASPSAGPSRLQGLWTPW